MKFPYKKIGIFLRPIIPIEILYESSVIRYEVLVDSGADVNIIPAELGDLLGIDVPKGKKDVISGITGGGMSYFVHNIAIRVGGWAYTVPIGFMPDMPSLGYGVMGQRGFFDLFRITFDREKAEIELRQ